MEDTTFKQFDRVLVHNLGPLHQDKEYSATIEGIAIVDKPGYATYIIRPDLMKDISDYEFTHITMPEQCLKLDPKYPTFKFRIGDRVKFPSYDSNNPQNSKIQIGTVISTDTDEDPRHHGTFHNSYAVKPDLGREGTAIMVSEYMLTFTE